MAEGKEIQKLSPEADILLTETLSASIRGVDVTAILESRKAEDIITREVIAALSSAPILREFVRAMLEKAMLGDVNMIKLILSYVEGMPTQKSEMNINQNIIRTTYTPEQMEEMRRRARIIQNINYEPESPTE